MFTVIMTHCDGGDIRCCHNHWKAEDAATEAVKLARREGQTPECEADEIVLELQEQEFVVVVSGPNLRIEVWWDTVPPRIEDS